MRISDWSSDVCSSDLAGVHPRCRWERTMTSTAGRWDLVRQTALRADARCPALSYPLPLPQTDHLCGPHPPAGTGKNQMKFQALLGTSDLATPVRAKIIV